MKSSLKMPIEELAGPDAADWKTEAKKAMKTYNERYSLWKTFDKSQLDQLKSYVGLMLFGRVKDDETTNSEVKEMYFKYDEKNRKIIDNIVSKFQFENGQLCFAHTLLYLSENDWQMCVFRQMKLSGEINFIDFNGRVYTSWSNFVKANKIPKCEYIAPLNGIHDITTDEVELNRSPASSAVGTVLDYIALGATVTSIALIGISVAPVTATVLGAGSAAYGVGQSFHSLWDRKTHKQSIAPTNIESVGCYMSIGTAALCGVSSSLNLVKRSTLIVEQSGNLSSIARSAIKGVNYTAAASTITSFGFHLYVLQRKLRNGDASYSDLIDLCIDVFLMYGAVCSVREMRSYIANVEINPTTPPKGLSKGARRRWRKRNAKLSSASSGNQNVTKVGAWDPDLFRLGIGTAGVVARKLLHHYCPAVNKIYDSVCTIIDSFEEFLLKKISLEAFCSNLTTHGYILYKYLKNNSREIMETVSEFLQRNGIIVPPKSVPEISNIVDDALIGINNASDESLPDNGDDSDSESNSSNDRITYEMILDLVKHRIWQREIATTEQLLSAFSKELASTVDEIKLNITQEYENMLSYNIRVLGEEKTKMSLSSIGINSKNDFADQIIERVIESLQINDHGQTNILGTLEKQLDELFLLYKEIFATVADENGISSIKALETCEILNNSIEVIIQPLTAVYVRSKEIYELNVKYFDAKSAMIFVRAAMNSNDSSIQYEDCSDSTLLDLAIKNLNISENKSRLLSTVETTHESNVDVLSFTDDFKIEKLLLVCDFYAQRIRCDEKNITKIYSFVTEKFIDYFQSLASQQNETVDMKEKLELNIKFLGKKMLDQYSRFLRKTNSMKVFNQVVEVFRKKDFALELIAEYYKTMGNVEEYHAQLLKHIVADDGVTLYKVPFENRRDIEEFKQLAGKLFNVNKHLLREIKKAENLVLLRKGVDSYILFQFVKNEADVLVMQIDLKENQEN